AVQAALAAAVAAAAGAGVGQRLTADRHDLLGQLHAHGLRSWVTEVRYRCRRTQALSFNPSTAYGSCSSCLRCSMNAECQLPPTFSGAITARCWANSGSRVRGSSKRTFGWPLSLVPGGDQQGEAGEGFPVGKEEQVGLAGLRERGGDIL